jgi:hypothetical protein
MLNTSKMLHSPEQYWHVDRAGLSQDRMHATIAPERHIDKSNIIGNLFGISEL